MEITLERFNEVLDALEKGEVRVAEKVNGIWIVNKWVKEVVLAGFRLGAVKDMVNPSVIFSSVGHRVIGLVVRFFLSRPLIKLA